MSEITTAEELDALPVGSVVRSGDGQIWQRVYRKWDCLSENSEGGTYDAETVVWQTGRPTATVLYRPDVPTLSDAALVEEAARRGMTVMDAAEAARLREVEEGVEKLADEWEQQRRYAAIDAPGIAMLLRDHADHLRALLPADDEPEVSA